MCDFTAFIPLLFSLYDYDFISLASPFSSLKEYSVISVPMIPWVPNWKRNQWQWLKLCQKARFWAMCCRDESRTDIHPASKGPTRQQEDVILSFVQPFTAKGVFLKVK